MDITLNGNSLAREMEEIEGVKMIAKGGAMLKDMLGDAVEDRGTFWDPGPMDEGKEIHGG